MRLHQSITFFALFFLLISCSNTGKESSKESQQSTAKPALKKRGTVSMSFNFGDRERELNIIPWKEGQSLYDIMDQIKVDLISLNVEDTLYGDLGHMIVGFENVKNQSPNYWVYCVNGMKANRGIDDIDLKNKDVISWYYTSDMNPCKQKDSEL